MKDIFDNISDEEIEKIAKDFPALSKKEKEKVYKMSERKFNNDTESYENNNEVSGVEVYNRKSWSRFASMAAALVIGVAGIGGSFYMISRNGSPENTPQETTNTESTEVPDISESNVSNGFIDYFAISECLTGEFTDFVYSTEDYELDYSDTLAFTIETEFGEQYPINYARLADERFDSLDRIVSYASTIFTDDYINGLYALKSNDLQSYANGDVIPIDVFYANEAINTFIEYDGKIYARDNGDSEIAVSFWNNSSIEFSYPNDRSFYAKRTVNILTPLDTGETTADIYFYIVNTENSGWKIDNVLNKEDYMWKINHEQAEDEDEVIDENYEAIAGELFKKAVEFNDTVYNNDFLDYDDKLTYPTTIDTPDGYQESYIMFCRYTNDYFDSISEINDMAHEIFTDGLIGNMFDECEATQETYEKYPEQVDFVTYNGNLYQNAVVRAGNLDLRLYGEDIEEIIITDISDEEERFYAEIVCTSKVSLDSSYVNPLIAICHTENGWKIYDIWYTEHDFDTYIVGEYYDGTYDDIAQSVLDNYWEFIHVFSQPYSESVDRSDVISFNIYDNATKPYHRFISDKYTTLGDLNTLLQNTFSQAFINNYYSNGVGTDMSEYNDGDTVPDYTESYNFISYNGNLYCNEPGISQYMNGISYEDWTNYGFSVYDVTDDSFKVIKSFESETYYGNINLSVEKDDLGNWLISAIGSAY